MSVRFLHLMSNLRELYDAILRCCNAIYDTTLLVLTRVLGQKTAPSLCDSAILQLRKTHSRCSVHPCWLLQQRSNLHACSSVPTRHGHAHGRSAHMAALRTRPLHGIVRVSFLWSTMPGRNTHVMPVFTPQWGYIHSSDSKSSMRARQHTFTHAGITFNCPSLSQASSMSPAIPSGSKRIS